MRDWLYVGVVIIALFCLSSAYEYMKYRELLKSAQKESERIVSFDAQVLLQYIKQDKNYYVLKLHDKHGAIFWTTSRDNLKDLRTRFVNIYGKLGEDCDFIQYVKKGCFVISFSMSLLPKGDWRNVALDYIDSQHENDFVASDEFATNIPSSLYKAIFLAAPLDISLRQTSAILGVAHILAISGFHLGILVAVFYGIIAFVYRFFQRRYFTYRNEFYDINFILVAIAMMYLVTLHFTPSFLRSFAMFACGFFVLWRGFKILSFQFLFLCAMFVIALFPKVIFSIGFWLSVSGIFYIYLYAKYAPKCAKFTHAILLNAAVYLNMLPIVHAFFRPFSAYQLLSPFITLGFVVFYPCALFLHVIGFGDVFDGAIFALTQYDFHYVELHTPLWLLIGFVCLSLAAMYKRFAYYCVSIISITYCLYGLFLVAKEIL